MGMIITGSQNLLPPFSLAVASGLVPGWSSKHKYGHNDDIDTGVFEVLWAGGGLYPGFNATGAETVQVSSDSASDTAAGVGAQTVEFCGLSAAGVLQSEIVTLDGTNWVDTSLQYLRQDTGKVRAVGSTGVNVGTITTRQKVTTANVFCVIPPAHGSTMQAAYTIPAGFEGLFESWNTSLRGATNADIEARLMTRRSGESWIVAEEQDVRGAGTSGQLRPFRIPKNGLSALTDVSIEAAPDANNIGVAGGFDLYLRAV